MNWVFEGLKKPKTFSASALEEAGAGQGTSDLLHNFTLVKVEEVHLTGLTFLHLIKSYYFHLKIAMPR